MNSIEKMKHILYSTNINLEQYMKRDLENQYTIREIMAYKFYSNDLVSIDTLMHCYRTCPWLLELRLEKLEYKIQIKNPGSKIKTGSIKKPKPDQTQNSRQHIETREHKSRQSPDAGQNLSNGMAWIPGFKY